MTEKGKIQVFSVLLAGLTLWGGEAYCGESGKIYRNGSWENIASLEDASVWSGAKTLLPSAPVNLMGIAARFLDQNARLLDSAGKSTWAVQSTQLGEDFQTARLERKWNGIPVVGGELLLHVVNGKVVLASADELHLERLSTEVRLSAEDAKGMAFASYRGGALSAEEPRLKVLALGENQKEAHLVYEVTVHDRDGFSSDIHFIDANSGKELLVTTNVHTLRDRKVLSGHGTEDDFDLVEANWKTIYADKGCGEVMDSNPQDLMVVRRVSAQLSTPVACHQAEEKVMASAQAAWNNSGLVYDYFKSNHRRDSIDGRGMQLKSVVNFGSNFPNAAWINNKSLMIYGMGDGRELNDFAVALDVAGHELTHGVTARTSGLQYVSESGALNESYSDVFGKLVAFKYGKATDWKLGKELFKDGVSSIRDMENPEVAHMKDFRHKGETCSRMNDFCGVHSNSGIPNKAAVLIANRIGLQKLGKLYYTVLTQMLRANSTFREARAQTEAACSKMFGAKSADCAAVREAFVAVGI